MPLSGAPLIPAGGVFTGTTAPGGAGPTNGAFSRFNLAQDAVVSTPAARWSAATADRSGQYGCVPFNPFGGDPMTPGAQVAYFDGQNGPGGTHHRHRTRFMTVRQEAFSFSVNGSPIERLGGPGFGRVWL